MLKKFCKRYLTTFTFIYILILVVKLCGIDKFGLDYNNRIVVLIDEFATKYYLVDVIKIIILWISTYILIAISCNDYTNKSLIYSIVMMLLIVPSKILLNKYLPSAVSTLAQFLLLGLVIVFNYCLILKRKFKLTLLLNFLLISILNILYQASSSLIRGVYIEGYNQTFIETFILQLDYLILLFITYVMFKDKEENNLWIGLVGSFGDLWHSFGQSLVSFGVSLKLRLQSLKVSTTKQSKDILEVKQKNKNQNKENNLDNSAISIIFLILFIVWNFFTVFFILFVAEINNSLIECALILLAFLVNKAAFGKPLHLKKASTCFFFSNLAYWILNRITLTVTISITIPILLGISLSLGATFVASYLTTTLVRGMDEESVNRICLVNHISGNERIILIDFYAKNKSIFQISRELNYSEINIQKLKASALAKIKK